MIAQLIAWSARNLMLVLIATAFAVVAGVWALTPPAPRRHPRPLGHAGHRLHGVSRAGPASGRGPGHLSAHHFHADRAALEGRARVLLLRRLVRLRHLRGRHRHLLGAQPRPRISQRRSKTFAGRGDTDLGARRQRRRLGLSVRGARQEQVPRRSALAAGLGDPLRAVQGRGRCRGRERRRLREAIQCRHRSRPHALARHLTAKSARRHPRQQHGCRGPHARACRARVHGARPRLSQRHGRP